MARPRATSVGLPGTFHIIDGLSKTLLSSLTIYEDGLRDKLAKMVQFFHAPWTRALFSHALVPAPLQELFKSGPPAFGGGRAWGIIEQVTEWLVSREEAMGELRALCCVLF